MNPESSTNSSFNPETEKFFRRWVRITEQHLMQSLDRHKIHYTGDLKKGLRARISDRGDKLLAEFYFKSYGRFVDMGVGSMFESTESNRDIILGERKSKPWYSKPFFGRLNNLRGAIGYQMMEQVVREERKALEVDI